MQLPSFLAADDHGFISLANHRVGLHHVVRLYNDGYSPEMIAESYPTLELSLIYKTIAFYLDHHDEVEKYTDAEEAKSAAQIAASPQTPDLAELRRRFRAKQAATQPPGR